MDDKFFIEKAEAWITKIVNGDTEGAFADLSSLESQPCVSIKDFISLSSELRFTPLDQMPSEHAVIRVFEHDDGVNLEYALPVDGEWSLLTAVFEFFQRDGKWQFSLVELTEI